MAKLYVYTAVFKAEERRRAAKVIGVPVSGFPSQKAELVERMKRAALRRVAVEEHEEQVERDVSWPPDFLARSLEARV